MMIRRLALALMPLAAGLLVGAATSGKPEPACVLAERWVQEHRGDLPSTLAEISEHPLARRKAIMMALPVEQQISLWREQFAIAAAAPDIDAKQRAFLLLAGDRAEKLVLASARAAEGEIVVGLDEFGREALETFGRERAGLLFANIGIGTPEERLPMEEPGGNCTCNNGGANWCGSQHWVTCADPWETQCSITEHGCGWFLSQTCNGKCVFGTGND